MKVKVFLAIIGLIIGIFLVWGGEWIIWDWTNSIVRHNVPWFVWDEFCSNWFFYAPLFIYKWTCETWTGPFDLGKLWMDLGIVILGISAFALGYYSERVVRVLKKAKK